MHVVLEKINERHTFSLNTMEIKCQICDHADHKYKCPRCALRYCSLDCWEKHKNEDCQLPQPQECDIPANVSPPMREGYRFPTEDTVPLEQLKMLGNCKELRTILENPHVRDILNTIDKSPNPGAAIHEAMLEPIFVEFADECFNIISPGNKELL